MSIFRQAVSAIAKALPSEKGYAHCDIPCGIYDPIAAKIAAQTARRWLCGCRRYRAPSRTMPGSLRKHHEPLRDGQG